MYKSIKFKKARLILQTYDTIQKGKRIPKQ